MSEWITASKCESFVRCVYNFLFPDGVTSEQHPEGDGELKAVSRQSNGDAMVCWVGDGRVCGRGCGRRTGLWKKIKAC